MFYNYNKFLFFLFFCFIIVIVNHYQGVLSTMNSSLIIASGDISSSPVLGRKFRGKVAKEIYRCGKGVVVTRSIAKPIGFAISTIPAELSKGIVYSAAGQVGEAAIGYISGIGFLRYLYKIAQPEKLKASARLAYNLSGLPMTLYSKGIGGAFDIFGVSQLEEQWFGTPVYIFDDNRLWIEKNFTLAELLKTATDE